MNRGIHTRGYLPHWDLIESAQAITFRLADSVPIKTILKWKDELASIEDDASRQKELHLRIAKYEDMGHGESLLGDKTCATIVQDKLIENHNATYKLIGWVIMPNHVHVLIRLLDEGSLSSVIQKWKGGSATKINRHLNRRGSVWSPDYYDRFIRDQDHLYNAITYIHNNPVKAGLSEKPEDWQFSSIGTRWEMERGL